MQNEIKKLTKTSIYRIWANMKTRCLNKNNQKYKRYGGRGIKICEKWKNNFMEFYIWSVQNGWVDGLTIDRIDNDGNYEPSNCRWITKSENSRKKSTTKIDLNTAKKIRERMNETLLSLSKEYNCSIGTIWFIRHNLYHLEEENGCVNALKKYNNRGKNEKQRNKN